MFNIFSRRQVFLSNPILELLIFLLRSLLDSMQIENASNQGMKKALTMIIIGDKGSKPHNRHPPCRGCFLCTHTHYSLRMELLSLLDTAKDLYHHNKTCQDTLISQWGSGSLCIFSLFVLFPFFVSQLGLHGLISDDLAGKLQFEDTRKL